jgi:hypothetical protein
MIETSRKTSRSTSRNDSLQIKNHLQSNVSGSFTTLFHVARPGFEPGTSGL